MQIKISNIKMQIGHNMEEVISAAQEIARLNSIQAQNYRIYKQSIDARRKQNVHYVYQVVADLISGQVKAKTNIEPFEEKATLEIHQDKRLNTRPVVVGMGPCGLFAAYLLAKSGNPPLLLERGDEVERRAAHIKSFWDGSALDPESNIQFGEGGAGTFSDGKLNTRISDPRQRFVLQTFVDCGAPEDILYRAKPHIGTDELRSVIRNLREKLISMGTEVCFRSKLTGLRHSNGRLNEIEINGSETVRCNLLILAIGHSSRDTYEMLFHSGVAMEQKPFAAGVRIEHTQRYIDEMQYGSAKLSLPAADYRLVHNGPDRSCYSFCMCPGGTVVNASSETGHLVVNGMSLHRRDGINANSALVVNVKPEDFSDRSPLAGVEFQRKYERLAFELGGDANTAPVQLARDFLHDRPSVKLAGVSPSFTGGFRFAELKHCLPDFIVRTLRDGLADFESKMKGFASGGAVLTGVEMRTSAPVRFPRDEKYVCRNVLGLYPAGEGAGYAGGIVSAAVDGIRIAQQIMEDLN